MSVQVNLRTLTDGQPTRVDFMSDGAEVPTGMRRTPRSLYSAFTDAKGQLTTHLVMPARLQSLPVVVTLTDGTRHTLRAQVQGTELVFALPMLSGASQ